MTASDYASSLGIGAIAILLLAFPFVFPAVLVGFSRSLPAKKLFVLLSGVCSYGGACVVALLCSPFFYVGEFLSAQMQYDGYDSMATFARAASGAAIYIVGISWLLLTVAIPLYARSGRWQRLVTANQALKSDVAKATRLS